VIVIGAKLCNLLPHFLRVYPFPKAQAGVFPLNIMKNLSQNTSLIRSSLILGLTSANLYMAVSLIDPSVAEGTEQNEETVEETQ